MCAVDQCVKLDMTSSRPLQSPQEFTPTLVAVASQTQPNEKSMIRTSIRALSFTALFLPGTFVRACKLCFPLRVLPMSALPTMREHGALGFLEARPIRSHQPRRDVAVEPFALVHPFRESKIRRLPNHILWSNAPQNDSIPPANPQSDENEQPTQPLDTDDEADAPALMSSSMIGAIGFYKYWISPLLPPACRFVPTCSIYGIQAIKEFGPYKGAILTAWRILRCSPFGGKGYDPPKWPPVFYTYSSY